MSTRRDFFKQSGLLLGTLAVPGFLSSCNASGEKRYDYKPGLQLYTVREAMEKAPKETLEKVANIGYLLMEHATYSGTEKFYGMSPSEFAAVLKQNGLKMPSGHYALGNPEMKGTILGGWEKAVEDAHNIGMKFMVCPWIPEEQRTLEDYKKHIETFNKAGEVCKNAGIQFCYHNHNFEFQEIDGQVPYDLLLNKTDKDLVKMEMDIFWISRAGKDPVAMIEAHPGRFVLWHVKDMSKIDDDGITNVREGVSAITEVGNGVIDWPAIFAHAGESGLKDFFVEQDITPGNPFDSIKQSYSYLEENILS